jgi:dipeptidyl-peptidase 4
VKRIACLLFSVFLTSAFIKAQPAPQENKKPLTIEAIFREGGITGRAPETIKWSPDNKKISFVQRDDSGEHGQLWYVDTTTGEKKVLVSEVKLQALAPPLSQIKDEREKERITRYNVASYEWAPDSHHLLFNAQGQLWMYDTETGTAVQFTSNPDPSSDPKFSPDSTRIAYLRKHNLYVRPLSGKGEKQLTKDKDENLLDGEVDWVYAEELGVRSNYFWSPGGKEIAFLQMDETQVPNYPIVDWLPTHPKTDMEKYPKAGDPNPNVRIGVISAAGGKPRWISLTGQQDIYIPRFGWMRDGMLWTEVLNRTQDTLDLYFVDANSGRLRKVLTERARDAWINLLDDFRVADGRLVLKSGNRFLWPSWRDGHMHLYLYRFEKQKPLDADAKLERQLTQGDFEVLGIDGIDDEAGAVYFTCNKDDPRQRQLYYVKLDVSDFKKLSLEAGTHGSTFSGDGKQYVDNFSAMLTPPRLAACTAGGPCKAFWDSRSVNDFGLIAPKALEFQAEDGTKLYGHLLLPPEGVASGKIPLIVYIYGGPAAQVVRDEWVGTHEEGLFHQLIAQHGYAVFSVDNRGTPARDRKFQTAIRHQFGAIELRDQLTAVNRLLAQFPQLDRARVGIWGWSNGGYMTLYAMMHSDLFKAGASIAPVTDWHDYDSTYTERYLGLPKDNAKGFDDSSTIMAAKDLRGALLLVHGSSDDNVHFQNSIQMIQALVDAAKQFRFMTYPAKTHGIGGSADRDHLFHMIEDHFQRELK